MGLTLRQQIVQLLSERSLSAREVADTLLLNPAEVESHLSHVQRSLKKRLQFDPAQCIDCGYVFERRQRLDAPGRCPRCKSQRVDGPWFRVLP